MQTFQAVQTLHVENRNRPADRRIFDRPRFQWRANDDCTRAQRSHLHRSAVEKTGQIRNLDHGRSTHRTIGLRSGNVIGLVLWVVAKRIAGMNLVPHRLGVPTSATHQCCQQNNCRTTARKHRTKRILRNNLSRHPAHTHPFHPTGLQPSISQPAEALPTLRGNSPAPPDIGKFLTSCWTGSSDLSIFEPAACYRRTLQELRLSPTTKNSGFPQIS